MAESPKFDRGTLLSIFKSDRAEDLVALVCALLIVVGTVYFIPR